MLAEKYRIKYKPFLLISWLQNFPEKDNFSRFSGKIENDVVISRGQFSKPFHTKISLDQKFGRYLDFQLYSFCCF